MRRLNPFSLSILNEVSRLVTLAATMPVLIAIISAIWPNNPIARALTYRHLMDINRRRRRQETLTSSVPRAFLYVQTEQIKSESPDVISCDVYRRMCRR